MSHECEHCKKVFSNKSNLKKHQTTARYCLKIQGKIEKTIKNIKNEFVCLACNKKFTRKDNFNIHTYNCKEFALKKKDDEIRELKKLLKTQKKEMKSEYEKKLSEQKAEYKQEIAQLQEKIQELAKLAIEKPTTTTTTTNNNILNLTPFLMDDNNIKDKIDNYYNMDYLKRGQRGVAEFTKDNILLDDEGHLKYICSDAARMIFKYKDQNGEMRKDVKASKLSNKITPNILKKATDIITTDVSNRRHEDGIEHVMDSYKGLFNNIQRMDKNPSILGNELSQLTT